MSLPDPVLLRIWQNLLDSVAEEMGSALERTGFSPNIRERRDFSCAIFDARGGMVAQAAHIPVHLGAMPLSVEAAIAAHRFEPGDAVLLNDPWRGGTHLPDLTLVSAFFEREHQAPTFHLACRAHHADVGGAMRGSMAIARDIHGEGFRIPPVPWQRRGEVVREVHELLLANVRQPEEREGDLAAQMNALRVGDAGLARLIARSGRTELLAYCAHLQDAAERHVRALLALVPDGRHEAEEFLEGVDGTPIALRLAVEVRGDRARFDFAGSAPEVEGPLNANRAIVLSAVLYALRILAGEEIPANAGTLRPVEVRIPAGSILDPAPGAAVAGGNVETSQRLVDLVLAAFARALPDRVPAQSQGTMNNLTLGGRVPAPTSYYETIGGGGGGHPRAAGLSGRHSHMTNTRNTPVEALERALPVRVRAMTLRERSGGAGRHPGGEGVLREIEALAPLEGAILSERRRVAPRGLAGGAPGATGRNTLVRADGREEPLPALWQGALAPGEALRIETPGGGGWGDGGWGEAE